MYKRHIYINRLGKVGHNLTHFSFRFQVFGFFKFLYNDEYEYWQETVLNIDKFIFINKVGSN